MAAPIQYLNVHCIREQAGKSHQCGDIYLMTSCLSLTEASSRVTLEPVDHASHETESRQSKCGPQDDLEVRRLLVVLLLLNLLRGQAIVHAVDVLDCHSQGTVGEQPERNKTSTESLVAVVYRWHFDRFLGLVRCHGSRNDRLERLIDIVLVSFNFLYSTRLGVLVLLGVDCWQGISFVRSFCSPTDIVQVAKSVDVENVDERRSNQHVLGERGDHVPRISVQNRGDQIDTKRRS